MRTVDPARYEAKRRHIMAAAAALFAQKGFERTTTADICTRAGISSGALFHYFPNKRAIFAAMFEDDAHNVTRYLASVADWEDPWGAVLGLIDNMVEGITEPEYAGLALEVIVQAMRDEEFAATVGGYELEVRRGLTELLERAARKGQIDRSVDPVLAAGWISAVVDSLFIRAGDPDFVPAEQLHMLRLVVSRFLQAELR
jgi:AcrR family transcriptional regulator